METPLHIAVREGTETLVRVLLDARASLAIRDERQQTALHLAAARVGSGETIMRLLLASAPSAAADSTAHRFPLTHRHQEVGVVDLLTWGDEDKRTPLHVAAASGHGKVMVVALIENGAPLDAVDKNGRSPLMVLSEAGDAELVQACLTAGAGESAAFTRDNITNERT